MPKREIISALIIGILIEKNHISLIDDIFDCLCLILKSAVVFWMSYGVFLRVSRAVFEY